MLRTWIVIALLAVAAPCAAQSPADEAAVRAAEARMAQALIEGDVATVRRLIDPAFVVNSPANAVSDGPALFGMVESGFVSYSAYERATDRITFIDDLAVVMGAETVTPGPRSPYFGGTVKRRYTNVWKRGEAGWTLLVRQATLLFPPPGGPSPR